MFIGVQFSTGQKDVLIVLEVGALRAAGWAPLFTEALQKEPELKMSSPGRSHLIFFVFYFLLSGDFSAFL